MSMSVRPKVTVIVVNYNSRGKWDVVHESLEGVLRLSYRPLEIIIVDNGSTDGSYELIRDMLRGICQSDKFRVRLIRLSRNYGFAAANMIAYRLRDPTSRYIALINNDLAPTPESLTKLIKILETHPRIAGVQGIILTWDEKYIDSYSCLIDQHGLTYNAGSGLEKHYINKLRPTISSYVDGAYSVYRIEAIERSGGLFLPYFFMYGDDYELGIRLWRNGWILASIPIIAGKHYRSATISIDGKKGKSLLEVRKVLPIYEYWDWLSNTAVLVILYNRLWLLRALERFLIVLIASLLRHSRYITKGFINGIFIGIKLRKRLRPKVFVIEPRLHVKFHHELIMRAKLFIRYRNKSNRIYSLIINRSLGKKLLTNF